MKRDTFASQFHNINSADLSDDNKWQPAHNKTVIDDLKFSIDGALISAGGFGKL
jgi:hypothetical protein